MNLLNCTEIKDIQIRNKHIIPLKIIAGLLGITIQGYQYKLKNNKLNIEEKKLILELFNKKTIDVRSYKVDRSKELLTFKHNKNSNRA